MSKFEIHRFFCPKCGQETLPIARKNSKLREKGHLKKLYCYHCKETLNMVECRDDYEVGIFREEFDAGNLAELVEESEMVLNENH